MAVDPYFADMPYGENDSHVFGDAGKLADLQELLVRVDDCNPSTELVNAFLGSYRQLYRQLTEEERELLGPRIVLGSLFDLLVSAKYAERLVADGGWTYCSGERLTARPSAYFCYLKTCPRCSHRLGEKPLVTSNKPGSDAIGEMCGDATYEILAPLIASNSDSAKLGKNSDRMHDVDFVIYDQDFLTLGETKSSPLVVYPLAIELERPLTEIRDGERANKQDHSEITVDVRQARLHLYIPHCGEHIDLGNHGGDRWPYQGLEDYVSSPGNVKTLIAAWKELYDVYEENLTHAMTDNRKWLTCGCGGGVDDSKNKPGMDRTDDIKKGTYQSLKFGTYYKEKDSRRIIRSVLASNFFPLRTYERYLSELVDVIWTKDKYSQPIPPELPPGLVAFSEGDLFYLYDAIICFTGSTGSIYMDERLKALTNPLGILSGDAD